MYTLQKGNKNAFGSSREEKRNNSVYLRVSTWERIDEIAEDQDMSRNEVIRDILRDVLQEHGDADGA